MNRVKTLLNGKVKIKAFPVIIPSSKQVMEGQKRIFLEKGELAEIYNSQDPIRHIAYVEFIKGKTRGGHYHTRQEYFYIIKGEIEFEAIDIKTKARVKTKIKEGDLVFISQKIFHTFKPIKAGQAIEFSKRCFRPDDTIKYNIHE